MANQTPFSPAKGRFIIGSLDAGRLTVTAQYNPKEIQMDRSIDWKQKDLRDNRPDWLRQRKSGRVSDNADVEYTGAGGRTLSFELLFDGYERNESIEGDIRKLEEMACVRDPDKPEDEFRRPHHCVAVFGDESGGSMGKFRCVIEKLSVKYSMFSSSGAPVRATASLTLKEAYNLKGLDASKKAT